MTTISTKSHISTFFHREVEESDISHIVINEKRLFGCPLIRFEFLQFLPFLLE